MTDASIDLGIPGLGKPWADNLLNSLNQQFVTHLGSKRAFSALKSIIGMLDYRLIPEPSAHQLYPKGHIALVWERQKFKYTIIVSPDHMCYCQLEENDKVVGSGELPLKYKESRSQNLLEILKSTVGFLHQALTKEAQAKPQEETAVKGILNNIPAPAAAPN